MSMEWDERSILYMVAPSPIQMNAYSSSYIGWESDYFIFVESTSIKHLCRKV